MSALLAFGTIAGFEIRQRLRRLSTWVYFALFFAIAALCVLAAGGAISGAVISFGGGGKVFVDSPSVIHTVTTLIGLFGTTFIAAIAGQATYQDLHHRTTGLYFTLPITKHAYLAGRLVGALVVCALIYAAIGLGYALTVKVPLLEPSRLGAHPGFRAYLVPYLVGLWPNLFVTVAIFFSIAALTRKMVPVYAGSVILLLGYIIALNLVSDVQNKNLTSLLDPFGLLATDRVTEYWSPAERSSRTIPLEGMLLYNRLLWCAIGAALLALAFVRFSFQTRAAAAPRAPATAEPEVSTTTLIAGATIDRSLAARARLFASLVRLQLRETVKSVVFLVLLLAGLLFMFSTTPAVGQLFGTPTWPVTYAVLELFGGTFSVFALAIITFYSGELVWRERDAGLSQIYDALPVPRGFVLGAKLVALVGVDLLLLALVFAGGIVVQTALGYHHYEVGLYARWLLLVRLPSLAFITVLAIFVHVIVNHKYVGHFIMIGYYGLAILLPKLGFEHPLYLPGSHPSWKYSDMNGFGHFVRPLAVLELYWAAFAVILGVLASWFWVRGVDTAWAARLRLARERVSRASLAVLGAAAAAFASLGVYAFWNMDRLQVYRTTYEAEEIQAQYERRYKATYDGALQPRITSSKVAVELYPEERRVTFDGSFGLENEGAAPVDKLFVNLPQEAKVSRLALEPDHGARQVASEPTLGVRIYELARPLAVGEKSELRFSIAYENPGFSAGEGDRRTVANGSFFGSERLPSLGYDRRIELADPDVRKKHHLPERARMRDLDDPTGLATNYVSLDGDWIDFSATIGTRADQIAIAPGYLQKQWTEGGRAHFAYAMDSPILNFYSFNSARYAVTRDSWNGIAIEVYHHPTHDYDVPRMIRSIKASLEYFTREFSPYQHKQVRIVEFPRYMTFAQSFPNTIPYSESVGFIARVDDSKKDEVDFPFYVTSHEVAHQWWAHQLIGGDVQGSTMLSETFAQYSALMVMKHTYGERSMRKFLRYSLDRYLTGRSMERDKELPLMRVEDQPYIHYEKGSLVMYALQDAIGEAVVNRALRRLLEKTAFKGPPYPNTRVFLEILREEAPKSAEGLIHDLFEMITLYELRATAATARRLDGDRNEVTVKATAKKLYANANGNEVEVSIDEDIAFGALDAAGNALAIEKRRVSSADASATFVVEGKPAKAGIDPLNIRIDRRPDDNVLDVTFEGDGK